MKYKVGKWDKNSLVWLVKSGFYPEWSLISSRAMVIDNEAIAKDYAYQYGGAVYEADSKLKKQDTNHKGE